MTNAPTTQANGPSSSRDGGSTEQIKAEAHTIAETTKQAAGEVKVEAGSQAAELAHTARAEARHRVDGEFSKLANFVSGIGEELHGIADGSPPVDGHLPGLARDGAQAADRLSRRLEAGGLDGALHDVSMFARRRPGTFLAAAFGVGIVLGRLTRNADVHAITEAQRDTDSSTNGSTAGGRPGSTVPSDAAGSSNLTIPERSIPAPTHGIRP